MFRPTGFADLAGKRVGIFGYGVEGRAAERRLGNKSDLVLVDDRDDLGGEILTTTLGGHDALLGCDVVLKSPGIARRRADVLDLERHGVTVTSALNLWFLGADRSRVVALTGTKGKSTTTALTTFFLQSLGDQAQSLGNIGRPPYDVDVDTSVGWLVVEVSSFQCVDLEVAPRVVVVTSLGSDHLDWHGSLAQYHEDKLALARAPGAHRTLVPDRDTFHRIEDQLGGDVRYVERDTTGLAATLGLLGAHSDDNVALALAVVHELTGAREDDVRAAAANSSPAFEPLSGRLTLVTSETINGATLRYVDDGLATAVLPTVAALDVFVDEPVALIAGGFDRGVDYGDLAVALAERRMTTTIITLGDAGERIAAAVAERTTLPHHHALTMKEAVEWARGALVEGGVVLLSPAAPSFDQYRNWEERSADFSAIARFLAN